MDEEQKATVEELDKAMARELLSALKQGNVKGSVLLVALNYLKLKGLPVKPATPPAEFEEYLEGLVLPTFPDNF